MTDKAIVLDRPGELIPSADTLNGMFKLAQRVAQSGLAGYKATAESVLTVAVTGRELGLPFMAATRGIHVVEGKPSPSAALVAALIYKAHGDNALRVTKTTDDECTVRYKRAGWDDYDTLTLTMEEAQRAGWHLNKNGSKKDTWTKYPKAMLRSRAITMVGQDAFPDVVLGLYTPDELDSTDVHVEDVTDDAATGPGTPATVGVSDMAGSQERGVRQGQAPAPVVAETEDGEPVTADGEIIEGEYEEVEEDPLTEHQQRIILDMAKQRNISADDLNKLVSQHTTSISVGTLTRRSAAPFINVLREVPKQDEDVMDSSEETPPSNDTPLPGNGAEFFGYLRDFSKLRGQTVNADDDMFATCEDSDERLKTIKKEIQRSFAIEINGVDPFDEESQQFLKDLKRDWGEHIAWTPGIETRWQKKYKEVTPV